MVRRQPSVSVFDSTIVAVKTPGPGCHAGYGEVCP